MSGRPAGPWWRNVFVREAPLEAGRREQICRELAGGAALNPNYLALILASCAIATFGLFENSPAVIIGAMIIAPLMPAIQAVAYGALEGEADVVRRGAVTLGAGVLLSITLSAALARVVGIAAFGTEILGRASPTLLDLGIALAAGAIGAFARIRVAIAGTLAGTAIAVALMPPLCVVGIGAATGSWRLSRGALLLFVTNLLGITLAGMLVFFLAGLAHRRATPALLWTGALTALIVVPLAFSFRTLVREAALEAALRTALTQQTSTFRQATLVSSRFDWLSDPPVATLVVRSNDAISSHQVALLEGFARHATGQRFRLVVELSQVESVTSEATPSAVLR
jgi:uncharacterized hydrophobic protein (TIGR00271 family)